MRLKQTLLLLILFLTGSSAMSQTVKWFAGIQNDVNPETNYNNVNNVLPKDAYFNEPSGIAWDNNKNMWITEKNKIRMYNGTFHNRAGLLGNSDMSFGYLNKTGILAAFFMPSGIVSDASGALYIADDGNHAIRKLAAFVNLSNGQAVTTFAGKNASGAVDETGEAGTADGAGYTARFNSPKGIVRDASGNFYVADSENNCIRKISSTGDVVTLSGKAGTPGSVNGSKTNSRFETPYGIAILDATWLVVSDYYDGTIRKVHMTTGESQALCGLSGQNVFKDGNFTVATFRQPRSLAVVDNKIYVCDYSTLRVIDINSATVSTFAGSQTATGNKDGEGGDARFGILGGIAYDGLITLYVTDIQYNVIKTVTINNLAPNTEFSANKTNALVDEVINFTNNSTGKPATAMKWSITPLTFKVGTGSLTSSPVGIKFNATGFYSVSLEVTNAYGMNTKSKTSYISVSTTGISRIPEEITLGVYPNPSTGLFTLQSLYGNYPIRAFEVMDMTGKVVLTRSCSNSLIENIDLSLNPSGLYILRVITSSGTQSLKLQKN